MLRVGVLPNIFGCLNPYRFLCVGIFGLVKLRFQIIYECKHMFYHNYVLFAILQSLNTNDFFLTRNKEKGIVRNPLPFCLFLFTQRLIIKTFSRRARFAHECGDIKLHIIVV